MFKSVVSALAFLAALVTSAVPATAQWLTANDDNPFDKTSTRFVYSLAQTGAVFGVRCVGDGEDGIDLIFGTQEKLEAGQSSVINGLGLKVALIIDGGEKQEFAASADSVEMFGTPRLRLTASGAGLAIVEAIAAAKKRVSVASVLGGKAFHVSHFAASGSRGPLMAALKACGVKR